MVLPLHGLVSLRPVLDCQHKNTMSSSQDSPSCPFGHGKAHPMKPPQPSSQKLPEHLQNYMQQSGEYLPESLSSKPTPSTIPRLEPTEQYPHHRWHYPSPQRFYLALKRKGYIVSEHDIDNIITIHNTVNETTWREVLKWELNLHWNECQDVRLEKFQGRPKDLSAKAWSRMALGFKRPFDRHDWIVNRCGERVRYIIDFYEGKAEDDLTSVHLDVRPDLSSWQNIKDRMRMFFKKVTHYDELPEDRMNHILMELQRREEASGDGEILPKEDVWNGADSSHGSLMSLRPGGAAGEESGGCPVKHDLPKERL